MANVIFSTFTNLPNGVLDSFRQGFVNALAREGNNVLLFTTNEFLVDHNASNGLAESIDKCQLTLAMKEFKPDLFISVNHSGLFPALSESIDCQIGIWLLDGPAYLIDPEECRAQASRYQMYIATRAFRNDLNQSFGISNSNIHDLPLASDFQAHTAETIHNISFVGTNFTAKNFQEIVKRLSKDRNRIADLRALIASYKSNPNMIFAQRIKLFGLENAFTGEFDEAYVLNTISINKRIKVLDSIEDLGLTLYGTSDWPETIQYSLGLALSFDPSPVLTGHDLENIYNASEISVNISHTQARGGLPWRVFDIMSCNSALISDPQEDFLRLFGEDIQIPIYESPSEARELCAQLLKDESHRRFIVQSCNSVIESGHRFKHRLSTMSEIFGINLLPGGIGEITQLNAGDYKRKAKESYSSSSQILPKIIADNDKKFSLQLFQSNLIDFVVDNSKLLSINIPDDKRLYYEFELPKSKPFLRLDIGEYFSRHNNVRITISLNSQSSTNNSRCHAIDLSKDIIQSNELHWKDENLYCGFDSFCIFENPFPNKDIKLNFESTLITYLKDYHANPNILSAAPKSSEGEISKTSKDFYKTDVLKTFIDQSAPALFQSQRQKVLLSQFLGVLRVADALTIDTTPYLKNYSALSDYNRFINLTTEIQSASHVIDRLNKVYPILSDEGRIDMERFTNLLYGIAISNVPSKNGQNFKGAIGVKLKAKLLYYRLKEKYNTSIRQSN